VEPIKLFDEMYKLRSKLGLSRERIEAYQGARKLAWDWLYSKHGPMKTYIWSQYFEDIPNDPETTNRNQVSPMEWAKYITENSGMDNRRNIHVPALIHWVLSTFGDETISAIKEQTWCYESMGSHSSRFGSTCAMWYEITGDPWYRDQALRHLNYASYMTHSNGVVSVGHKWPGSWFSDGYGDYVRHFFDAMAAVPEWAPADENHLLKSSSVIQTIEYGEDRIRIFCYNDHGIIKLKLKKKPARITVDDIEMDEEGAKKGICFADRLSDGAILVTIRFRSGNHIQVFF
jgi:hypothetical protein